MSSSGKQHTCLVTQRLRLSCISNGQHTRHVERHLLGYKKAFRTSGRLQKQVRQERQDHAIRCNSLGAHGESKLPLSFCVERDAGTSIQWGGRGWVVNE